MSRNEKITVYDVIGAATEEGEWVNGEFEAVVRKSKPRQGNKPSKADLCDPHSPNIKVAAAWFGGDLSDFEGATVLFGGKGMKVKSYKGNAELNIGKDALVNLVTAAPSGGAPKPAAGAGSSTPAAKDPPPAAKPNVDPVTYFHREMSKQSLAYLHCIQYAREIDSKTTTELSPEHFQAVVSSLFIQGHKDGLFSKVPKLREEDADGLPLKYIPPTPPATDPAEVERQRIAAEEKAKAEAAEKARREHDEKERQRQQELDEDVPF